MVDLAPPTDNGREVPGLAELARRTIRLHPRPGEPTAQESHIGGPLLWPSDEPWPYCDDTVAAQPAPKPGVIRNAMPGIRADHDVDRPMPLVAAAQFFQRDFPSLPFPEGTDLLQVLLCPDPHEARALFGPAVHLVWRNSREVTELLGEPPAPLVTDEWEYIPRPCVLAPCEIVQYPDIQELPTESTWSAGSARPGYACCCLCTATKPRTSGAPASGTSRPWDGTSGKTARSTSSRARPTARTPSPCTRTERITGRTRRLRRVSPRRSRPGRPAA